MAVSSRRPRRRYVVVLLVLTAFTLIALDQRAGDAGPLGTAGGVVHDVVAPIGRATDAVLSPVADWFDGVVSSGSLKDDNRDLHDRLTEAESQLERAQDLIAENEELRRVLGLDFVGDIPRVTARVVTPAPGNFEQTVTIDRGSAAGVRVGSPVVSSGGLFGRVLEVSDRQATVLLVTDEEFGVAVRVSGDVPVFGIASGRGGGRDLALGFAEVDEGDISLVEGDAVLTSGRDDSRFPAGIPVGEVVGVEERPGELAPRARVRPVVSVGSVEYVQVLDWDPARDPQLTPEPDGSTPAGGGEDGAPLLGGATTSTTTTTAATG